jgi:phage terminase large subunit-like protein
MSQQNQEPADFSRVDYTTEYAQAVVDGIIIAGPHVRNACKRHLKDLEEATARGYYFDLLKASRVIEFFQEVLYLNGGKFEGVPYDPLPWQKFILGSLFGWVNADGYRRFKVAFVEAAKGCGKSPMSAGVGLYCLLADGEARAEVYAAAAKKDQAMILFRDAVAMAELSPELSSRLIKSGVGERAWNIAYPETGSFFRPIASDDSQSGPRPHCALLDEIHEHKNPTVVDMMEAGTKGRTQALIFMITNSGYDKNSICGIQHDYAVKVASGMEEDDSLFSYVCALDEGENPFQDESCWIKTNPSLGVTIQHKYLRDRVNKARGMPSMESIVRRLNFCEWVGAESPWISSDIWFGAQDDYTPDTLYGRRCWAGLDLSSTKDLTSLVLNFEPTEDDPFWRLLPTFWVPAEGLKEKGDKDGVDYLAWVRNGWLETTPGRAIDKMFVLHRLAEITSEYDLQLVAYDRWRIEDLKQMATNEGIYINFSDFGQGFKDMAPAVDVFESRLLSGEQKHNGNPAMTWCAANTVMADDPAGNRKPAKNKSTGRIDGIVAAVMAAGAGMLSTEEPSMYETQGIQTL